MMKQVYLPKLLSKLIFLLPIIFLSCKLTTSVSKFSQDSLDKARILKMQTTDLMNKGTESYATHAESVEALKKKLSEHLETEKLRSGNENSVQMWTELLDPEKNLLGGFFSYWNKKDTISSAMLEGQIEMVSLAFDKIIEAENAKNK